MEHLHDEFDEADMKFLQKFAEIEKNKQDVDEVDPDGVKQAQNFDHKSDAPPMSDEGLDEFHGDDDGIDGDFDHDLPEGQGGIEGGGGDGESDEGESEGEGESGEGEGEGDGDHTQNQDSEQEGIDQKDKGRDKDGSGKLSEDGEGEPDDDAEDGDGDGKGDDDAEGESEEGEQGDGEEGEQGESEEGDDGESGSDEDSEEESGEGEGDDDEQKGEGKDGEQGEQEQEGEPKPECDGNCDESDEKDGEPCPYCDEKKQKQGQQGDDPEPIALDRKGDPIFIGSEVKSKADGSKIPDDAVEFVGLVLGLAYGLNDEGDELAQRMIVVRRRDHLTGLFYIEGEGDRTGWGLRSDLCEVIGEQREQKHDHKQDEQEGKQDEQDEQQREDFDFEIPDDDGERKPLTQQQKSRFQNLCERIFKKSEQTFGNTIESDEIGPDLPGGLYDGEEIAKTYEVKSRGVVYRVTVSAERYE